MLNHHLQCQISFKITDGNLLKCANVKSSSSMPNFVQTPNRFQSPLLKCHCSIDKAQEVCSFKFRVYIPKYIFLCNIHIFLCLRIISKHNAIKAESIEPFTVNI